MSTVASVLLSFWVLALAHGAWAVDAGTPEDTVRQYLTLVQKQQFENVYDLVSTAMKRGKTKEVWAKEQQYLFQFSEAKIFDFEVGAGKVEGATAKVPNLLSSQDKFLNQLGVEEHELYTLVREEGRWKVDQQEILVGNADIAKWFPGSSAKSSDKTGGTK